jgi:hypothetical protein
VSSRNELSISCLRPCSQETGLSCQRLGRWIFGSLIFYIQKIDFETQCFRSTIYRILLFLICLCLHTSVFCLSRPLEPLISYFGRFSSRIQGAFSRTFLRPNSNSFFFVSFEPQEDRKHKPFPSPLYLLHKKILQLNLCISQKKERFFFGNFGTLTRKNHVSCVCFI